MEQQFKVPEDFARSPSTKQMPKSPTKDTLPPPSHSSNWSNPNNSRSQTPTQSPTRLMNSTEYKLSKDNSSVASLLRKFNEHTTSSQLSIGNTENVAKDDCIMLSPQPNFEATFNALSEQVDLNTRLLNEIKANIISSVAYVSPIGT